ncbi:hypothetical protein DOV67_24910 [Salmonella enterica subsp. enterica serovar Java]|uniref:Uncharacterized protein n=3 Tax=Salmonella enterica TaxID=28901 RepID=A0A3R0U623_SALER|nr:hypothetical protein [Salmonella enterica subsp. enterica serovar Java]EBR8574735.1 hypothetical protein [Salmonella enterica subsp. enterica serovar Java]ECS8432332.1 hypothetical protein [Salmonella enterica]MLE32645.1 hypothetical protein [Salmonella enterica]
MLPLVQFLVFHGDLRGFRLPPVLPHHIWLTFGVYPGCAVLYFTEVVIVIFVTKMKIHAVDTESEAA